MPLVHKSISNPHAASLAANIPNPSGQTNTIGVSQLAPALLATLQSHIASSWLKVWKGLYISNGIVHSSDWDTLGTITAVANTTPVQVTIGTAANITTGDVYTIAGNTAALNGSQTITRISDTVFSVNGSTAQGTTAGGTVSTLSTITEGIGDALLLAVDQKDKTTFDAIAAYYLPRMLYSNLNIGFWRWDTRNNHHMIPASNFTPIAPDGDMDICWAHILANELNGWGNSYTQTGINIWQDLYRYCTAAQAGKLLMATSNVPGNNPASDLTLYPDYPRIALYQKMSVLDPVNFAGSLTMVTSAYTIKNDASNNICSGKFVPNSCLLHAGSYVAATSVIANSSLGTITAVANTTPVQVTVSIATPITTGDVYTIAGNTAALNGSQTITRISDTVFSINGSTAQGTTAGGTVSNASDNSPTGANGHGTEASRSLIEDCYAFAIEGIADAYNHVLTRSKYIKDYPIITLPTANWQTMPSALSNNATGSAASSFRLSWESILGMFILNKNAVAQSYYTKLIEPAWNATAGTWPRLGTTTAEGTYFNSSVYLQAALALKSVPSGPITGSWSSLTATSALPATYTKMAYYIADTGAGNVTLGTGSNVVSLLDQTSGGRHFTQTDGSTCPTQASGINSQQTLNFTDASSQTLTMNGTGLDLMNNISGIFISIPVKTVSGGGGNYTLFNARTASGLWLNWYIDKTALNYNVNVRQLHNDGSAINKTSAAAGATYGHAHATPYILSLWVDYTSNTIRMFRNGRAFGMGEWTGVWGTAQNTDAVNCTAITLGSNNGGNFYKGEMGGPVIVPNASASYVAGFLSAIQGSIEQPLAAKFGVTM